MHDNGSLAFDRTFGPIPPLVGARPRPSTFVGRVSEIGTPRGGPRHADGGKGSVVLILRDWTEDDLRRLADVIRPVDPSALSALESQPNAAGVPDAVVELVADVQGRASEGGPGVVNETHDRAQLRCEGEYWTVTFDGREVRLRDGRGIRFLAELLCRPHHPIHAVELVASCTSDAGQRAGAGAVADGCGVRLGLGNAGATLDARARAAYRERLEQLRSELAEAEARHDSGTTAHLRREVDFLTTELLEAARGRRAADHAERARLAVTKTIKAVLQRLAVVHPALAAHLKATVRRGYLCVYTPDPRTPITWSRG
jgi:hypothetical protein